MRLDADGRASLLNIPQVPGAGFSAGRAAVSRAVRHEIRGHQGYREDHGWTD